MATSGIAVHVSVWPETVSAGAACLSAPVDYGAGDGLSRRPGRPVGGGTHAVVDRDARHGRRRDGSAADHRIGGGLTGNLGGKHVGALEGRPPASNSASIRRRSRREPGGGSAYADLPARLLFVPPRRASVARRRLALASLVPACWTARRAPLHFRGCFWCVRRHRFSPRASETRARPIGLSGTPGGLVQCVWKDARRCCRWARPAPVRRVARVSRGSGFGGGADCRQDQACHHEQHGHWPTRCPVRTSGECHRVPSFDLGCCDIPGCCAAPSRDPGVLLERRDFGGSGSCPGRARSLALQEVLRAPPGRR